jgi:hypothetical protein
MAGTTKLLIARSVYARSGVGVKVSVMISALVSSCYAVDIVDEKPSTSALITPSMRHRSNVPAAQQLFSARGHRPSKCGHRAAKRQTS